MRSLASQPASLWALFSTEMWERFAYFGTQSILTLYLTSKLGFTDSQAFLLFAAINALIYITPVLGGYLADCFIGYRSATLIGLISLVIGYLLMGNANLPLFEAGMSLVIIGNGLVKPNISTLLGLCYQPSDPRRDNGFTLFYIGINIGATAGVILCGVIAKTIGWHIVFWLSGALLLSGIVIFSLSKDILLRDTHAAGHNVEALQKNKFANLLIAASIICLAILITYLLQHPKVVTNLLSIFMTGLIIYLFIEAKSLSRKECYQLIACLTLILFSVAFWMLYQQAPMSLMLFIDRCVNLQVAGINIPASSVWAISGIALLIFAPLAMAVWRTLAERKKDFSYTTKFSLGIALMGLGYLLLAILIPLKMEMHKLSLSWIVFSFTLQSLGELCLSPIGLAMVTVLAPARIRSLMLGVWFLSLSLGSNLAGKIANWAVIPSKASWQSTIHIYHHAFGLYGSLGISISFILFCLNPIINRLSKPDIMSEEEKK